MAARKKKNAFQKFLVFYKWLLITLSVIGPVGSLIAIGRIDLSLIEGLGLLWGFYGLFMAWDKMDHGEDARFSFKGWTFEFTKHKKKNKDNE